MKGNFETCMKFLLPWEGGFTNDPQDPGAATNFGITLKTLESWRRRPVTAEDVRKLSLEEAKSIYLARYWDAIHGDLLPPGVDLMVFDYGVNEGPRTSTMVMQDCLGVLTDGYVGPKTLAAAAKADPAQLLGDMAEMQKAIYRTKATFARYGRGLLRRTDARLKAALAMVDASAVG